MLPLTLKFTEIIIMGVGGKAKILRLIAMEIINLGKTLLGIIY